MGAHASSGDKASFWRKHATVSGKDTNFTSMKKVLEVETKLAEAGRKATYEDVVRGQHDTILDNLRGGSREQAQRSKQPSKRQVN